MDRDAEQAEFAMKEHPDDSRYVFLFQREDMRWIPVRQVKIDDKSKQWAVAKYPGKKGEYIIFRKLEDRWKQYTTTSDAQYVNRLLNDFTSPATSVATVRRRK